MKLHHILLISALSLLPLVSAWAVEPSTSESLYVELSEPDGVPTKTIGTAIYFRAGHSTIDPEYRDNGKRLAELLQAYTQKKAAGEVVEGFHIIASGASPDGSIEVNKTLSLKRAKSLSNSICSKLPDSSFTYESLGEDWEGLSELVASNPNVPDKAKVLDIIENTPIWVIKDGVIVDGRKRQLMNLSGGRTWNWMLENIYPELRYAKVEFTAVDEQALAALREAEALKAKQEAERQAELERQEREKAEAAALAALQQPVEEPVVVEEPQSETKKPFYMAVKTNLLHDAVLIPNIGLEFHLGKGWSILADWNYAWWHSDRVHWYEQTYGGDIELRKYFGKAAKQKPLTGHHLGLYGQLMTYDIETGGRGYQATKWNWGGGISYGYSLPVAKRLNIDFTLGLGYIGGMYEEYLPQDTHYVWQATKRRNYFGPTRAEISLVWLIGRGNVNAKFDKSNESTVECGGFDK